MSLCHQRIQHARTEKVKTDAEKPPDKTRGFHPVSQDNTVLRFSMTTGQGSELQEEEVPQVEGELETALVVKMVGPCMECNGSDCSIEDNVGRSDVVEGDNILILGWTEPDA